MVAENRLAQQIMHLGVKLRNARLVEVCRSMHLSPGQRFVYFANGLELDALPSYTPIRYWYAVWSLAVAYGLACSIYVGGVVTRRGEGLINFWLLAFVVALAQEVLVVAEAAAHPDGAAEARLARAALAVARTPALLTLVGERGQRWRVGCGRWRRRRRRQCA